MVVRAQRSGRVWILHDRTNLLADEFGDQCVAVDVAALVGPELAQYVDKIPNGPGLLEALATLGIVQLPAHGCLLRIGNASERPSRLLAVAGPVIIQQGLAIRWHWTVVCGQGKVGCTLKDGQMYRLLSDQRDRLDARRARTDHGDALAGELDLLMRPPAGKVNLAFELLDAIDLRRLRCRETAGRHNVIATRHARAAVGCEHPA